MAIYIDYYRFLALQYKSNSDIVIKMLLLGYNSLKYDPNIVNYAKILMNELKKTDEYVLITKIAFELAELPVCDLMELYFK